ncbi:MAG: 50S ribosomal protein L14e [Nanoarchaeota archaeon]
MLHEIGRICIKIAGRDAGKRCAIVEVYEGNIVLIDGETRRRKCNIKHLEPLAETIPVKKGASHADIIAEFKKIGIEIAERKAKKPAATAGEEKTPEQTKSEQKKSEQRKTLEEKKLKKAGKKPEKKG